jgi:hypothetical protein
MTDEKLAQVFSEGRMIAAVDNVIFPLIDSMIEIRRLGMVSRFTSGKTDFIADAAYMTALSEIKTILKQKQIEGQKAFHRLDQQKLGDN